MLVKIKKKIINIPLNIDLTIKNTFIIIKNKENSLTLSIELPHFIDYLLIENKLEFFVKSIFLKFQASKMFFYTFVSKFLHQLKGISELYRGVINIQGLGYSVAITKLKTNKYNLFFRFGFKDKYNYIMPDNIIIEKYETVKTKMVLYCFSLELLKQVQMNIQRLRYPKAFKLQGIYLNDFFPKVKKFIK